MSLVHHCGRRYVNWLGLVQLLASEAVHNQRHAAVIHQTSGGEDASGQPHLHQMDQLEASIQVT